MKFKFLVFFVGLTPTLFAEIHFRVYTWPLQGLVSETSDIAALPELFYLNKEDQPKRLRISRGSISQRHRYDGESPLRLVQKTGSVGGEDQFSPFAQVRVQRNAEHTLLIFNPDQPRSNGGANVSVMHADPRRVPKGKATFYNTSSQIVLMNVDGRNFRIRSGRALIQEPEERGVAFSRMRVRLAARHPTREEMKMMFTGTLRIFDDRPNLFLVQEYGDRMQVRSIRGLNREE